MTQPEAGRASRHAVLLLLGSLAAGCAVHSAHDRGTVSNEVLGRTGHALRPAPGTGAELPEGVSLADGLSEDEAVAVALWRNADLEVILAEMGLAKADLVEAGLIRNPVFSILFPLGPKQLEFTLTWPIEALWQRPRRVAAAQLDVARTAERLVQGGLDLVRDVRLAYADAPPRGGAGPPRGGVAGRAREDRRDRRRAAAGRGHQPARGRGRAGRGRAGPGRGPARLPRGGVVARPPPHAAGPRRRDVEPGADARSRSPVPRRDPGPRHAPDGSLRRPPRAAGRGARDGGGGPAGGDRPVGDPDPVGDPRRQRQRQGGLRDGTGPRPRDPALRPPQGPPRAGRGRARGRSAAVRGDPGEDRPRGPPGPHRARRGARVPRHLGRQRSPGPGAEPRPRGEGPRGGRRLAPRGARRAPLRPRRAAPRGRGAGGRAQGRGRPRPRRRPGARLPAPPPPFDRRLARESSPRRLCRPGPPAGLLVAASGREGPASRRRSRTPSRRPTSRRSR